MPFDLKSLFTYAEVRKAFSALRRKNKFKPDNTGRDRFAIQKRPNALGRFIREHEKDGALKIYNCEFESYVLSAYRGMAFPKKSGAYRPLLVPVPRDRLVFLTALPRVRRVLKSKLTSVSALGVGVLDEDDADIVRKITKQILKDIKGGYYYVLALDFQNYFSSINRTVLTRRLRPYFRRYGESNLFDLVKASIENQIDSDSTFDQEFGSLDLSRQGVPQGLAYSPLLASFFGISIDNAVDRRSMKAYRYLDDMIVLARSRTELISTYRKIRVIAKNTGLHLHPLGGKTEIVNLKRRGASIAFLGIEVSRDSLRIPESSIKKFKDVLASEILSKSKIQANSHAAIQKVFNDYVGGWSRYYRKICAADYAVRKIELDNHVYSLLNKKRWGQRLYRSYPKSFTMPLP